MSTNFRDFETNQPKRSNQIERVVEYNEARLYEHGELHGDFLVRHLDTH